MMLLASLVHENQNLFDQEFLVSTVREANQIHKEIAFDYGIKIHSFFIISLNRKSAANRVIEVVGLVKQAFCSYDFLILHGNEVKM